MCCCSAWPARSRAVRCPALAQAGLLFIAVTLVTGMLEAKRQIRCAGPADAFPAQAGDRRMTGADAPTASRETEPQRCQLTTAAPTTGPGPRARERPAIPRARMIEGPPRHPKNRAGRRPRRRPRGLAPLTQPWWPKCWAKVLIVMQVPMLPGSVRPRRALAQLYPRQPGHFAGVRRGARLACGLAPPVPAARRGRLLARPVRV